MRFAIGAGGTGGHIIPALALATELKSRGHECRFIGNQGGLEERLVTDAGFKFYPIRVQKLYRKLSLENLKFPYLLLSSIFRCRHYFRAVGLENLTGHHSERLCDNEYHPDGIITTGGFVAGPVAIAGILKKIPCFLHESNSYPGLTTRYLARFHKRVFISFDQTEQYLKSSKLTNHGIPIMPGNDKDEFNLADIGIETGKKTLLITGGSQGSLALNTVISAAMPRLLELGWQVIWQTGRTSYQQFSRLHEKTAGLYIFDFHPQLRQMMHCADLAITRAGAMTIAELETAQLPAILIPLPTAAENHQYFNAQAQQAKGLAKMLLQSKLTPNTLLQLIQTLDLPALRHELKALPPNRATQLIIDDILSFYKE